MFEKIKEDTKEWKDFPVSCIYRANHVTKENNSVFHFTGIIFHSFIYLY